MGGPGTGWDLHEYRHSVLAHLGETGASLLILTAKSRHGKPENLRRDFKPSADAIAELTSLLAPGSTRRRPAGSGGRPGTVSGSHRRRGRPGADGPDDPQNVLPAAGPSTGGLCAARGAPTEWV